MQKKENSKDLVPKKKVVFKTYEEQIVNLQDHGLLITNWHLATEILKSRGYYNLVNRYKNAFYDKGTHKYKANTSLIDLYQYSRMEDDLRNILFRFTINFEQRVKENMSFIISRKIGINPAQYLSPNNYNHRHYKQTAKIISRIEDDKDNTRNNPTKILSRRI